MIASRKRQLALFAGTFLLLGSAVSARADYLFTFNGLTPTPNNGTDSSTAIAQYMDGVIGGACAISLNCVTVSSGVAVAQKYNGDSHVVGPGTGSTSLTLGNTDGATVSNSNSVLNGTYDSYISNTSADSNGNGPHQLSQQIIMTFSHGITLSGNISFDFEIFPDISGAPDFVFKAWNGASLLTTQTKLGVAPGTAPIGSTKSPLGTEASAQLIGNWSAGNFTNVTELDFIDWPATIGVDNLKIVTPEPTGGVFFLAGLALAALAGTKLRRAPAKS